jgi:hypothetical protein
MSEDPFTRYVMAVDIGKLHDYTAITIIKSFRLNPTTKDRRHEVIHLERMRDLAYPEQIRRIAERYHELEQHARTAHRSATVRLLVDQTGVGEAIVDAMREAGLKPIGVFIHGGEGHKREGNRVRVAKKELVTSAQVAMQAKRLRISPEMDLAPALLKELLGFKFKLSATGHMRLGNDVGIERESPHDDLVLSVSMATWYLEKFKASSVAALREASGLA